MANINRYNFNINVNNKKRVFGNTPVKLPSQVLLSMSLYPALQSHRKPIGRSMQICEHPPLFLEHSFTPQSSSFSSSQPIQSRFLLHTLERGIHEPSLHSNCVDGSQTVVLLVQFLSSLPSTHSALPLQYKWPEKYFYIYTYVG